MIVGNIKKNECLLLPFNKGVISRVSTVKYLGVILDDKLSWENYIMHIADKCVKGLSMLKCASNYMPVNYIKSLYYSFVYPYLQNGIESDSIANQKFLHKICVIQKSCIRIMSFASPIFHGMPLAKRLNILLFDDLQYIRTLVFMYVYFEHTCPVVQKMLVPSSFIHIYETRSHMYNFHLSHANSKISKSFPTFRGVLWNNLLIGQRELKSIHHFKTKLPDSVFSRHV